MPPDHVKCPLCGLNLSFMDIAHRETHADECLSRMENMSPVSTDQTPPLDLEADCSNENFDASKIEPVKAEPLKSEPPPKPNSEPLAEPLAKSLPEGNEKPTAVTRLLAPKPRKPKKEPATPKRKPKNELEETPKRKPPFFKTLDFPEAKFAVDAFCYGPMDVDAYFLTHFHSDHYGGLGKNWKAGKIYCTPATARLAVHKLKVSEDMLCQVPIGESVLIHGIEVLFLDANHCPGAAVILFNRSTLHTGDFRATPELLAGVKQYTSRLDRCYLDTTYLDPKRTFPSQNHVIDTCVQHCLAMQSKPPKSFFGLAKPARILVMVGTYTIGKERLAIAIAKALGTKIFAPNHKLTVLKLLEDPELQDLLLENGNGITCQVHLTSMMAMSADKLETQWKFLSKHYTHLLAFVPTGWTFRGKFDASVLGRPKSGCIAICRVPYSEHSSYSELEQFCKNLPSRRIIATVGGANISLLESWQQK